MMPILELVYVFDALAHGNVVVAAGRSPPSWMKLRIATPFTALPPIALGLRLGKHRLVIGGEEGPVWPA